MPNPSPSAQLTNASRPPSTRPLSRNQPQPNPQARSTTPYTQGAVAGSVSCEPARSFTPNPYLPPQPAPLPTDRKTKKSRVQSRLQSSTPTMLNYLDNTFNSASNLNINMRSNKPGNIYTFKKAFICLYL